MNAHPTSRSSILGYYIQYKGVAWGIIGFAVWWAALGTPELWAASGLRLFAYYLLVFAVPGVLMWTMGVLVKYRHPLGWYGSVVYLVGVVIFKVGGGVADLPVEAWRWVSQTVPPEYLTGLKIFGFLAVVVLATDVAALLAFLSPKGRDCFSVGKKNPDARG